MIQDLTIRIAVSMGIFRKQEAMVHPEVMNAHLLAPTLKVCDYDGRNEVDFVNKSTHRQETAKSRGSRRLRDSCTTPEHAGYIKILLTLTFESLKS